MRRQGVIQDKGTFVLGMAMGVVAVGSLILFCLFLAGYSPNSKPHVCPIPYTETHPDFTKMVNSSVRIEVTDALAKGGSLGSGTVIRKTSDAMYILTCAHVVGGEDWESAEPDPLMMTYIVKYTLNGRQKVHTRVEVIKYDGKVDLAIIKVTGTDDNLEIAKISDTDAIQGDTVYAVGNPLGYERILSKGIISSLREKGFIIYDGLTTFGNSGGGLYNSVGELIGVPEQVPVYPILGGLLGAVPESNLGNSVDTKTIREFVKDLK